MREFTSAVGGRYTYKADWENLQQLALSISQIFSECDSFVLSGCEFSGSVGNKTVSPGYIWMAGKIRYFDGATGVDLSATNYFVEDLQVENVKYHGGGSNVGTNDYRVIHQTAQPSIGDEFILIPTDGILPDINNTFFGNYAILSDPRSSKQTIQKPLHLNSTLGVSSNVSVGMTSSQTDIDLSRWTTDDKLSLLKQTITSAGIAAIQSHYNGSNMISMAFDPKDKKINININGTDQIVVSDGNVYLKSVQTDGEIKNANIAINGDQLNVHAGDSDSSSLKVNYTGYNGGISRYRDTVIYNGKNSSIATFDGSSKQVSLFGKLYLSNTLSQAIEIKHSSKVITDNSLLKSIRWADSAGATMVNIGYLSSSNNDFSIDNFAAGDITLRPKQYLNVSGLIKENGSALSDKYADKTGTANSLNGKVSKDGSKVLSDNNFTTTLLNKLNGITTAVVEGGNDGYVTGDQLSSLLSGKLNSGSNLSDIPNPSAALGNLGGISTSQADGKYLKISNNLSDVDAAAALANIGAAAVGSAYAKSEVYKKTETFSKQEVQDTYQPLLGDTGYIDALNPSDTGSFNVKIRRNGNVVNIIGSAAPRGSGIWFRIPSSIPPPPFDTGQVVDVQANGTAKFNRGMMVYCEGGGKDFLIRQEADAKSPLHINITYMV